MIYAVILFVTVSGPVEAHRTPAQFPTMEACHAALSEMRPAIITHAVRLSLRLRAEVQPRAACVHQGRPA